MLKNNWYTTSVLRIPIFFRLTKHLLELLYTRILGAAENGTEYHLPGMKLSFNPLKLRFNLSVILSI